MTFGWFEKKNSKVADFWTLIRFPKDIFTCSCSWSYWLFIYLFACEKRWDPLLNFWEPQIEEGERTFDVSAVL